MAKAPRKPWGSLSRKTRDRYARIAQHDYGISRRSARAMYNRGTWQPGTRNPDRRVPADVLRRPGKYAQRMRGALTRADLTRLARDNIYRRIGDYFKFNADTVELNLSRASDQGLAYLAGASERELTDWAHWQAEDIDMRNAPKFIRDMAFKDAQEQTDSIFWYH